MHPPLSPPVRPIWGGLVKTLRKGCSATCKTARPDDWTEWGKQWIIDLSLLDDCCQSISHTNECPYNPTGNRPSSLLTKLPLGKTFTYSVANGCRNQHFWTWRFQWASGVCFALQYSRRKCLLGGLVWLYDRKTRYIGKDLWWGERLTVWRYPHIVFDRNQQTGPMSAQA